jgi:hypothetical protein
MNLVCKNFLAQLSSVWPVVGTAFLKSTAYWHPDEPPLTVVFGDIGQVIVDHFDVIDSEVRAEIMKLIEVGIATEDEQLGIAVETGMIEAMTGAAANTKGRTEALLNELCPLSKAHAKAWLNL